MIGGLSASIELLNSMNRKSKVILLLVCFNLFGCNTFRETYIMQIRNDIQEGAIPPVMGKPIVEGLGGSMQPLEGPPINWIENVFESTNGF